jgi:hypothetical protein
MRSDDAATDECLRMLAAFISLKDRKSRDELIKIAEQYALSQSSSLIDFSPREKD